MNKAINKITIVVMIFALVFVLLSYYIGATSEKEYTPQSLAYESSLFNGEIFEVDIIADDDVWQEMLDNATNEEYVSVDVIVNGELFKNVGIRPKGNSSLQTVSQDPTSDRYSFKLKFDKYIDGQTCFGLDTMVLNNIMNDNTYMKEYISYDLMNFIGVEAVHYGYSNVLLNGEAWGLYLALETYNDSYLTSTYGTTNGYLYSAKSSDLFSDDTTTNDQAMPEMPADNNDEAMPEMPADNNDEAMPARDNMEGGNAKGMSSTDGGLDFVYISDDVDDYEKLFANNVGDEATDDDEARIVEALKALNENKNIEDYWDVDAILRYLAAHTVTANSDSISTNMCQNYYLYELDGVVTVLPWDYNETFGVSTEAINFPIDTPVSGVEMEERPIINVLFQNEEYLEKYHEYMQEIVDGYFNEAAISEKIAEIDTLINEYVKNDATAFYGYDSYTESMSEFEKVLVARSESISGQLDGSIPSTTEGQTESSESLIGIDNIDTSKLTSGNTSIGGTGGKGDMGGMNARPGNQNITTTDTVPDDSVLNEARPNNAMPDRAIMEQAIEIIGATEIADLTDEQKQELSELGIDDEMLEMLSEMPTDMTGNRPNAMPNDAMNTDNTTSDTDTNMPVRPDNTMGMSNNMENMQDNQTETTTIPSYLTIIICFVLLGLSYVFIRLYTKKK